MRTAKSLLSLSLVALAMVAMAAPGLAAAKAVESHWTEGSHPLESEGPMQLPGTLGYSNAWDAATCSMETSVVLTPGGGGTVAASKVSGSSCTRREQPVCGGVSSVDLENLPTTVAAVESEGTQLMKIPLGITFHLETDNPLVCAPQLHGTGYLELTPNNANAISSFSFEQSNIETTIEDGSSKCPIATMWSGTLAPFVSGKYGIAPGSYGPHWTRNGIALSSTLTAEMSGSIALTGEAGGLKCPLKLVAVLNHGGRGELARSPSGELKGASIVAADCALTGTLAQVCGKVESVAVEDNHQPILATVKEGEPLMEVPLLFNFHIEPKNAQLCPDPAELMGGDYLRLKPDTNEAITSFSFEQTNKLTHFDSLYIGQFTWTGSLSMTSHVGELGIANSVY